MQGQCGQVELGSNEDARGGVPGGAPGNAASAGMGDFESLLRDVLDDPEKALARDIDEETLLKIFEAVNPHKNVIVPENMVEGKRIAACSFVNHRETYTKRFLLISLMEFLYRVLNEWEPEEGIEATASVSGFSPFELDTSQEDSKKFLRTDPMAKELTTKNPEELYGTILAMAETYKNKNERAEGMFGIISMGHAFERMIVNELCNNPNQFRGVEVTIPENVYTTAEQKERATAVAKWSAINNCRIKYTSSTVKEWVRGFLDKWLNYDPYLHAKSSSPDGTMERASLFSGGNDPAIAKARLATLAKRVKPDAKGADTVMNALDPEKLRYKELYGGGSFDETFTENPDILASEELRGLYKSVMCDVSLRTSVQNALVTLDSEVLIRRALEAPDAFKRGLKRPVGNFCKYIPPQDTFFRWTTYIEVNYEELRTITDCLYQDKSDLEFSLAIWDSFAGTEEQASQWFTRLCDNNSERMRMPVVSIEYGAWSLLGDFKANRERINFYNKNTKILESILDRHAEDKKMGAELMRHRVRQQKAKEIKELGPDSKGLADYVRTKNEVNPGSNLMSLGAEKVISKEEMARLEAARGNIRMAKELEYLDEQLHTIKALEAKEKLTMEEEYDLKIAKERAASAREMLAVPEGAVQVDMHVFDTTAGKMIKSHFYTKSDEVIEEELAAAESRTPALEPVPPQ